MRLCLSVALLLSSMTALAQDTPNQKARNEKSAQRMYQNDLESLQALIAELNAPEIKIALTACNSLSERAKSSSGDLFTLSTNALINTLRDSREEMREASLKGLEEIIRWRRADMSQAAFANITRLTEDSDEKVRVAALQVVTLIYGAEALSILSAQFESKSSEVKSAAARLLGEYGDQRAKPVLYQALFDEFPNVRAAACKSLAQLQATDAQETLISLLSDPEEKVREEAAKALGNLRASGAVTALSERLYDPEKRVIEAAIESLGKLRDKEAIGPLLAAFSYPEKAPLNRKISGALVEIGDPAVEPLLEFWRTQRSEKPPNDCTFDDRKRLDAIALLTLKEIKTPAATHALLRELPTAGIFQVCILVALQDRNEDSVTEAFILGLQSTDEFARNAAMRGLHNTKTPSATKSVIALLKEENNNLRNAALEWISTSNKDIAIEALPYALDIVKRNQLRSEVMNALEILELTASPKAEAAILDAMEHPDSEIASTAALAAANMPSTTIQKKLINQALNPKSSSRIQSLRALSLRAIKHAETKNLSALAPLLYDKNIELSFLAARAIALSSEKSKFIQPLLKSFADDPAKTRMLTTLLPALSPKDASLLLLQGLGSSDERIQLHSAWALGQLKDKSATPALSEKLLSLLLKERPIVAVNVAAALNTLRDPAALPALKQCLTSRHSELRLNCVLAYSRSGGDINSVIALSQKKEIVIAVRNAALLALFERINEPGAKEAIEAASKENNKVALFAQKLLQPQEPSPSPTLGYARSYLQPSLLLKFELPDLSIRYGATDMFGDFIDPLFLSTPKSAVAPSNWPRR